MARRLSALYSDRLEAGIHCRIVLEERLQNNVYTFVVKMGGAAHRVQLHCLPHPSGAAHLPDGMHTKLWCSYV